MSDFFDIPGEGVYLKPEWAAWRPTGGDVKIGRWLNKFDIPAGFRGMPRQWLNELVKERTETNFIYKHSNWAQVEGFFSPEFIDLATILVPIRNPYKRAYSAYKFMMEFADGQRRSGKIGQGLSYLFDQDRPISFESFLSDSRTLAMVAAQPQAGWMNTHRSNVRYIRTENLAEDTYGALVSAGFSDDEAKLVRERLLTNRMNVTSPSGVGEKISHHAMELIEKVYRQDFESFESASVPYQG